MKYFIGYLIRGEAANWHIKVAKEISDKYGTWKIHEKLPPHITIYRPFDLDDIQPVKNLLASWASKKHALGDLLLSGFGHFDDNVVFAKVEIDQSTKDIIEALREDIQRIPGVPPEDFPDWHPHATVANHLPPEQIKLIWGDMSKQDIPSFKLPFDNVTLFRFVGDREYVAEEVYAI